MSNEFNLNSVKVDRNQDATLYVGNLDSHVDEDMLWELFCQTGPLQSVVIPRDRLNKTHQGYAFVEYKVEEDADYSLKILNMIKLYGKPIQLNKSSNHTRSADVGANLFIGNLGVDVDEKGLYDIFSTLGNVTNVRIMRDDSSKLSKGFGFVSYDTFESADSAISALNGQFVGNREISVQYAYKKDSKGERHGSAAERLLAAQKG